MTSVKSVSVNRFSQWKRCQFDSDLGEVSVSVIGESVDVSVSQPVASVKSVPVNQCSQWKRCQFGRDCSEVSVSIIGGSVDVSVSDDGDQCTDTGTSLYSINR